MSNATDTALLFNLTLLCNVINAMSVALQFDITLLRNDSNADDAALLFDCCVNNRNMSIFVVRQNGNACFEPRLNFYPVYLRK